MITDTETQGPSAAAPIGYTTPVEIDRIKRGLTAAVGPKSDQATVPVYAAPTTQDGGQSAEVERLREELRHFKQALTPSVYTKCAYIGEFYEVIYVANPDYDEDDEESDEEIRQDVAVSWTTIKAIMSAIRTRAAPSRNGGNNAA